jgi:hypothetical protein
LRTRPNDEALRAVTANQRESVENTAHDHGF